MKVKTKNEAQLIDQLLALVDHRISQSNAEGIIHRLVEEKVISEREAKIMMSVMDRSVLYIDLPQRDELRARMLKAMLTSLKYK